MSELSAKVSALLRERRNAAKNRTEVARITYAEGLVAPSSDPGRAEAMLAAMDELELGLDDLHSDAQAVKAARRIEEQLAEAQSLFRESLAALAVAERELHEAQRPNISAFDLKAAHEKVADAENLKVDREYDIRQVRLQLEAITATAPRIFAGHMRRLARASASPGEHRDPAGDRMTSRRRSGVRGQKSGVKR